MKMRPIFFPTLKNEVFRLVIMSLFAQLRIDIFNSCKIRNDFFNEQRKNVSKTAAEISLHQ